MGRFTPIAVVLLLSAGIALAQTPEVFTARANQDPDHPWTSSQSSNRFTVWYSTNAGDCANLSSANATAALNELEAIYDAFVHRDGYPPPYAANAANKYKMGVYVLRNGSNCSNAVGTRFCGGTATCSEGHAFGGTIGNPRAPGMWLSSGAVSDKWALAHEFMHGLQAMAGGMGGGNTNQGTNFRGWFYESHANLTPHQVYPNEVHYCAEMYTRMPQAYYGSTRNRYCNWQFFEYINHRYGIKAINDLWLTAQSGANHDPFTELMTRNNLNQRAFGDVFGDFATKMVIHDINRHQLFGETQLRNSVVPQTAYANRGSALFRNAYNGVAAHFRRSRYTYLEELPNTPAGNNAAGNRYVVPFAAAPQRYAYNIIRLYPDQATGTVTVRFRGDVQTANNITNYAKNLNLEPAVANLPNNPGSDWRYGLVAVTGDATSRTGTVTARYSELKRASDGNPDISVTMQAGETQLYLVVAATPTVHHKISWDQFYYTIYRFPYMVQIDGAKPEGFQAFTNNRPHSNGGGYVASGASVAATAYVGPDARVMGGTVSGTARIEGRAVVQGGTISGSAIVRDYAFVNAGTINGNAIIEEGANIWGGTFTENARVGGIANVRITGSGRVAGSAVITGAPWIDGQALNMSGTGKLYGDGEVYGVTITGGAYTGIVDAGVIGNNQHGANLTALPREVTAPRSLRWPAGSTDTRPATVAVKKVNSFNMNNRGVFTYSFSGGIDNARLKMFDSRGRLVNTIHLKGTTGAVDTRTTAAQMLFWKVEGADGRMIGKAGVGAVIR